MTNRQIRAAVLRDAFGRAIANPTDSFGVLAPHDDLMRAWLYLDAIVGDRVAR